MPEIQEIIENHLDWVRSLALRQTRDAHLADDITQAVFLTLHRKRPHENQQIKLAGWLFRTTQLLAREAMRKKIRRDHHERQAAALREATMQPADDSAQIATHIDAAVHELPTSSRNLVLLRFYRGLSFAAIAAQLGLTENATKKRMARTLDQLQPILARRGVAPSQDLGAVLALHLAVQSSASLKATLLATIAGATPISPSVARLCGIAASASLKPVLLMAASVSLAVGLGIAVAVIPHTSTTSATTPQRSANPPAVRAANVTSAPAPAPANANLVEYRFLLPDGKPAANALIFAGGPSGPYFELTDLTITAPPQNMNRYRADSTGRVRIPPLVPRRDALYVLHRDGYLLESPQMLQAGPDQTLMPYARIEGTLADATGSLVGRTIRVSSNIGFNSVAIDAKSSATTDAAGHFAFDRLLSGDQCGITVDGLPWERRVQLLPGETLPLAIMESGATVSATVDAPESPFFSDYPISVDLNSNLAENSEEVQFYRWAQPPLDKRRDLLRKVHEDGTWTRYAQEVNRNFAAGKRYAFACTYRNPTFTLPNLGPGIWHASIHAQGYDSYRLTQYQHMGLGRLDDSLAMQYLDITVAPGQRSVDLGKLALRPIRHLLVGDKLAPQQLTALTKEAVTIPDANAAITLVMFLGAGGDVATPQRTFAEAGKHGDVEFLEVMLGNTNEGWLRHRQSQAHWPQVQMKYWQTDALRLELGIADTYGPILLAFANDGTLLARAVGSDANVAQLLAQARERLDDPTKLKSAEAPKPDATPRGQLSRGVDSNRLLLATPQANAAPQPQPAPTTAPTATALDASLVAAADTLRHSSKEGYRFITDRHKGAVTWSKDGGRSVFVDGAWYAISKSDKAMRYSCPLPPDGPHQQIAEMLKKGAVLSATAAAPDHDKTVNGERWHALQTGFLGHVFIDDKLRIREVTEMPFGPARPEDAEAWKLPEDCVDIGELAATALIGRPPDKTWTYEDKRYALYRIAERKDSSIVFAVTHSLPFVEVVSRGVYLEGATQIRRLSNAWLCMRIASLQAVPMQIDWYYATPATISPELAGDLRFYMHPVNRPYRTKSDGTMVQDIAEPDPVRLPLPTADSGPGLGQLAADIHAALSVTKDLPVKALVFYRYNPQAASIGINDGSDLRSVSELTLDDFRKSLMNAVGENSR